MVERSVHYTYISLQKARVLVRSQALNQWIGEEQKMEPDRFQLGSIRLPAHFFPGRYCHMKPEA